jgi:hypothetical protein
MKEPPPSSVDNPSSVSWFTCLLNLEVVICPFFLDRCIRRSTTRGRDNRSLINTLQSISKDQRTTLAKAFDKKFVTRAVPRSPQPGAFQTDPLKVWLTAQQHFLLRLLEDCPGSAASDLLAANRFSAISLPLVVEVCGGPFRPPDVRACRIPGSGPRQHAGNLAPPVNSANQSKPEPLDLSRSLASPLM